MTISITPTGMITEIDGVPVRLWEGVTEHGIPVKVFVHRVAVHEDYNSAQFDEYLQEQSPPAQWVRLEKCL